MKFSLRSECQFDASCFVDTLTIQVKYVRFQFSIRDMGKDIPVQTGDRNRRIFVSEKIENFGWKSPVFKLNIQCERKLYVNFFKDIWENLSSFSVFNYNNTYGEYHPNRGFTMDTSLIKIMVIFCSKMFFEAFFQDEDHLYANCLFYNLTIYLQYFFFSVFKSWDTYAHSHPNRGSKKTHHYMAKHHSYFEAYFPRWRSLVYQLLVLYSHYLNAFFSTSYIVPYVSIFQSQQECKMSVSVAEKKIIEA